MKIHNEKFAEDDKNIRAEINQRKKRKEISFTFQNKMRMTHCAGWINSAGTLLVWFICENDIQP